MSVGGERRKDREGEREGGEGEGEEETEKGRTREGIDLKVVISLHLQH